MEYSDAYRFNQAINHANKAIERTKDFYKYTSKVKTTKLSDDEFQKFLEDNGLTKSKH